jgi:menaquinone-9 beta-reductase
MFARTDYDVVVVGARCAGAAAALTLAKGGAKVLMVDRDERGTDTLSTHALMRGAVMLLADWGLLPALIAAGTPQIRTTTFAYRAERVEVALRPGSGIDGLIAPRRWLLDRTLADAAESAGAERRYRTALRGLLRDTSGTVRGVHLTDPDGRSVEIRAGVVIGADGRGSSLARMVGAEVERKGRNAGAVIYAYVSGMSDRGTRWHYGPGIAAGAIPTNDGAHCVFAAAPPDRYLAELRGDLTTGLHRLLAEVDGALAAEVQGAHMVGRPRGFAGEPGFLRRAQGPGWALVGDAGYFKDPITAHGITDALRDGWLVGRTILASRPLSVYAETRDMLSQRLFDVTDRIAALPQDMEALKMLHAELNATAKDEQSWLAAEMGPALRAA